jgi:hypothetical protein
MILWVHGMDDYRLQTASAGAPQLIGFWCRVYDSRNGCVTQWLEASGGQGAKLFLSFATCQRARELDHDKAGPSPTEEHHQLIKSRFVLDFAVGSSTGTEDGRFSADSAEQIAQA